MKLLRQENVELRWKGSAFNLIGVDYQRQRDAEGNRAPMLVGVGTAGPARRPQYFAVAQSEFVSASRRIGHRAFARGAHARRPGARRNPRSSLEPGGISHALCRGPLQAPALSVRPIWTTTKFQVSVQPPASNLQPPASTSIAASARSARPSAWASPRKLR